MQDLVGKVAVVTGAASGIGRALANRFAAEGMKVVLADIEADPLEQAASDINASGNEAMAVVTDVRDAAAVESLAERTVERFGAAHLICNNAGVYVGGTAWAIDDARWRWIVDVNLFGVVNGVRAFVPRLIAQGEGHVVNMASAAGLVTGPGMAPYFATKHGVVALSEALHQELAIAGHKVGVSVVCPEFVRSNLIDGDRNAPDGILGVDGGDPLSSTMRQMMATNVAAGINPAEVAERVIEGIRTRRLYVLTHASTMDLAKGRWESVQSNALVPPDK